MTTLRRLGLAASLIPFLSTLTAFAQSDSCTTATPLLMGTAQGTTVGATNDGTANCGQSETSPDVWYRVIAPADGMLRINTCGSSYDTVLSVHSSCPPNTQLACNDDTGGICNLGSTVAVPAAAGTQYLIRVSGYNNASGAYIINAVLDPVTTTNDICSGALAIGDGDYTGTTALATNDAVASCGSSNTSPDVWYRYTATANCPVRIDTCGSAYDTVLTLFDICPGAGGVEIACNDDTGGDCGLGSTITFAGTTGTSYLLRLSGFNNQAGEFLLHVHSQCSPPGPDTCANAIEIQDGTFTFSTETSTNDGSASCGTSTTSPDVWFLYRPSVSGSVGIDTCGSSFDTVLSIHSACPGTAANQIACNDDSCALGSLITFDGVANTPYLIRVSGFQGAVGTFTLRIRPVPTGGPSADVYVGELGAMVQAGRLGDTIGCAIDSPLCNAGGTPLETMRHPDSRHPFFIFNMYRLRNDRFEQIGMSWAKHMQGSAQENACGFGCQAYPNGTHLGIGCSDTYGAAYNTTQAFFGPRSEINPWTGTYDPATSHLNNPDSPPHTPISHRLQLRDADLNPAQNAGATYFAEQYTLAHDDANHTNSIAREPAVITGAPGGNWNFDLSSTASTNGPAIDSWPGSSRSVLRPSDGSDGTCIIRAKVTDLGNGVWHYEYAIYNHDLDRGLRALVIPVGRAAVTNMGFSAPRSHDEPFHNNPWTAVRNGGVITFSTESYTPTNNSNPLRWGTLYNLRFDASAPPVTTQGVFGLYKPGSARVLRGTIPALLTLCTADVDGGAGDGLPDGAVGIEDLLYYLEIYNLGLVDADVDDGSGTGTLDGGVGIEDLLYFLARFDAGC